MKRWVWIPKFSTPLRLNIRMGFVLIIFEFIIIRTVSTWRHVANQCDFPSWATLYQPSPQLFDPVLTHESVSRLSTLSIFFFYSEWWNFVDSSFNVVQFVYYVSISYWWRNNVHNIYCLFPKLLICTNSSLTLVSWRQHIFFSIISLVFEIWRWDCWTINTGNSIILLLLLLLLFRRGYKFNNTVVT